MQICDSLIVIHGNGPISYRFREKRRFRTKMAIFLYHVFNVPSNSVTIQILKVISRFSRFNHQTVSLDDWSASSTKYQTFNIKWC